jgi:transposase
MNILGIDIAKNKFDVALLVNTKFKHKVFANDAKGFSALAEWLKKNAVDKVRACMEATGIYGEALATYLHAQKHSVSVVNPACVKGFAQSHLSRNKTDKVDSKLIAKFCEALKPDLWHPTPDHIKKLQVLVRRLQDVKDFCQQENNHLASTTDEEVQAFVGTSIQCLEQQIETLEEKISTHIEKHQDFKERSKLLDTIPGVGKNTIMVVLAFLGGPEKFKTAKQMAAFIGLNPKQFESGSSVHKKSRISKTGDAALRKAFYMPALSAMMYNPVIKEFCERLKAKGKHPMAIVCAAMRKLVHIIYGVLKSGKAFDPAIATMTAQRVSINYPSQISCGVNCHAEELHVAREVQNPLRVNDTVTLRNVPRTYLGEAYIVCAKAKRRA